jgi:hypothetical protein
VKAYDMLKAESLVKSVYYIMEYTICSLVYKYVLRASHNAQCVSIRKTSRGVLCTERIAVCYKSRVININALCRRNAEF